MRRLLKAFRRLGRGVRAEWLGFQGKKKTRFSRWVFQRRKAIRETYKSFVASLRPVHRALKRVRRALSPQRQRDKLAARIQRLREWTRLVSEERRVKHDICRVASRSDTIIVGPWLTEVGFEALYWIPFVNWFAQRHKINPERIIAVSRGGVESWYSSVANRYFEVFETLDVADFAHRSKDRQESSGSHKQYEISDLDREVLARVHEHFSLRRARVLHPSLMYRLLHPFWYGRRPYSLLEHHSRYGAITPPAVPEEWGLPERYVAVKFYTAPALPGTEANKNRLAQITGRLAERHNVVLLDTGLALDDHNDFSVGGLNKLMSAQQLMIPADNLGVQTQIIAGADLFVGTCGGLAWLAPMLGTDTVAIFDDSRLLHNHLSVALTAYVSMDAGRFLPVHLDAVNTLGL